MEEFQRHLNGFGYLLFSESELTSAALPKEQLEDKRQSLSARLKNVLFVEWKQRGSEDDFDTFYRKKMEGAITAVKSRLDPL